MQAYRSQPAASDANWRKPCASLHILNNCSHCPRNPPLTLVMSLYLSRCHINQTQCRHFASTDRAFRQVRDRGLSLSTIASNERLLSSHTAMTGIYVIHGNSLALPTTSSSLSPCHFAISIAHPSISHRVQVIHYLQALLKGEG